MLLDVNLAKAYWAEAVNTAAYLKNRSPTKALQGKTPFEAWYRKKPNVEHLKVFGCKAYAHIPKDERHKFDSKARKCVLLGYDDFTKGYRLYDNENKKIVYSRDVRFDEQSDDTTVESKPKQDTDRVVSIDSDEAEDEDNDDNENSTGEQLPQPQEDSPTETLCQNQTTPHVLWPWDTAGPTHCRCTYLC